MKKDFDKWNNKKKLIQEREFSDFVHKREVWWCSVGMNVGVEADGKHKNFERPVLVLRKFSQEAILAVCLTSRVKKDNPYHITYVHNGVEYAAVISQIRIISTRRLLRKVFEMSKRNFAPIREAVLKMIENKRPPR